MNEWYGKNYRLRITHYAFSQKGKKLDSLDVRRYGRITDYALRIFSERLKIRFSGCENGMGGLNIFQDFKNKCVMRNA